MLVEPNSLGELVRTLSPFRDGPRTPITPDESDVPFWSLHAYAGAGPLMMAYRPDDRAAPHRRGAR